MFRKERKGYTTLQLKVALRSHRCTTLILDDITAADNIPQPSKFPCFFIVNTSSDVDTPGHWLLLFFTRNSTLEYFDSLNKTPLHYSVHIENYINEYCENQYITNSFRVQPVNSFNCGPFCAYVADQRSQNVSFKQIMSQFEDTDLDINDHKVVQYYNNHILSPGYRIGR